MRISRFTSAAPVAAATPASGRPEAPWSSRAKALASQALLAAKRTDGNREAGIRAAVDDLLTAPELKGARISVAVRELTGAGRPIVERSASTVLNPASNSKLAAATFALSVLGPKHRFETRFLIDGSGHLYAVGSLDPSLSAAALINVGKELLGQGIGKLAGVVVDNSKLEGTRTPKHFDEFGDEDWEYLARPEAFSVDKNLLEITVTPADAKGAPARVSSSQQAFELRSSVTTAGAGEQFKVGCDELDHSGILERNERGQPIVNVFGSIAADYRKGKRLSMKSPDPVASAEDRLVWGLRQAGVEVADRVRVGTAPRDARCVFIHRSLPLGELVKKSLATSNAFDHEMYVLEAASQVETNKRTSLSGSLAQLRRFLAEKLHLRGFRMENASGIGNANRLSAADLIALIRNAAKDRRCRAILEGMAHPGEPGTLKTRMLGTPAEARLWAKTGTLKDSVVLSGYVKSRATKPIAFSMVINDYQQRAGARSVVDALGITLASL